MTFQYTNHQWAAVHAECPRLEKHYAEAWCESFVVVRQSMPTPAEVAQFERVTKLAQKLKAEVDKLPLELQRRYAWFVDPMAAETLAARRARREAHARQGRRRDVLRRWFIASACGGIQGFHKLPQTSINGRTGAPTGPLIRAIEAVTGPAFLAVDENPLSVDQIRVDLRALKRGGPRALVECQYLLLKEYSHVVARMAD